MQTDEPNIFERARADLDRERQHNARVAIYAQHDRAIGDIQEELVRASKWGPFHSMHAAFAHIHEEFDELKAHVWTKQKNRDLEAMRAEAVQVAAMAIKAIEVIDSGRGRV